MKLFIRIALIGTLGFVGWLGLKGVGAERGRGAAIAHMSRQEWAPARAALRRYLGLHPGDDAARLLLAEAFGRDEALDSELVAKQAIEELRRIPDTSPQAAKARTKEAVLRFLSLYQPVHAERLFRRALELDPAEYEAHYMLWKVLEMTGRSHLTEQLFWRIYELSSSARRPGLLLEWFLSEFSPSAACAPLDRKLGFLGESEKPETLTEFRRLDRFRTAEPESPIAACSQARIYLREGMRHDARKSIEQFQSFECAWDEPYCVATQLEILMEFGEFDAARECFSRWPQPREGYEYWKWKAILLDEIDHDDRAAIAAYDRALGVWPGSLNGLLIHRRAHCLDRLGKNREADEARRGAEAIYLLVAPEAFDRLRRAVLNVDNPADIALIVDFYQKLNRTREATVWEVHRRQVLGSQNVLLPQTETAVK